MNALYEKASEAAQFLKSRLPHIPQALVVLGSGLGGFAETLEHPIRLDYREIPHLPTVTVVGHQGRLVGGFCHGAFIGVMQGRFHFYEGYGLDEATFYIRVAKLLGVNRLVLTNSAGGLNPAFAPGDVMLIEDHLNLIGENPLRGLNDERFGPRFPDMTDAYDPTYRRIAHEEAEKLGMTLRTGVYAALLGPSYETPAEIKMLRTLGADAVGMSTAPEVIVARHMNMRVVGFSCIANLAAGATAGPINHTEVLEVGAQIGARFVPLLQRTTARICTAE
jgi:purine-nucleoside phosphorylase